MDTLVIVLSMALLWVFGNIWIYGGYLLVEPNLIIRAGESALFLVTLAMGFMALNRDVREACNGKT